MSNTSRDKDSQLSEPAKQEVGASLSRTRPLRQPHAPHIAFPKDVSGEFGRYRVIESIGHGGMGVVYRAVHETLDRQVALKILAARRGDESNVELRFRQEARAIARLHHSNIVPLFEVGEAGGQWFLVMQLIDGDSIDKVINRDRMISDAEAGPATGAKRTHATDRCHLAASIGRQAAEALAYAHRRGIVHRDVKPSNLILDKDEVTWLTDFGLAKFEGEDLTQTGECIGTIPYMSPEQLEGKADHRTDIYALGVTIFEFVTLRKGFQDADQWRLIERIKTERLQDLREIDRQVPEEFATVIAKATDPDPELRYQTAQAFADDLHRFLNNEPVLARRHTQFELLMRWARQNTELAAALTGIAALLVLLFAGSVWFSIRQSALRRDAVAARNNAVAAGAEAQKAYSDTLKQREKVEQQHSELQRFLYLSEMNVAAHAILQPFGGPTAAEKTSHWIPRPGETDLRDWEWYYLHAMSNQAQFASEPFNFWVMDVEPSPDGSRVAVAMNNGGVHIRDAVSGDLICLTEMPSRSLSWSRDGSRIAVSDYEGNLSICDAGSLETLYTVNTQKHNEVFEVCWSPDSKRVAVCGDSKNAPGDFTISIYDARLSTVTGDLQGHTNIVYDLDWSSNGNRIASASYDEYVRIWDIQTGQTTAMWKGGGDLSWNYDGTRLAMSSPLGIRDVEGKDQMPSPLAKASCVAWCPDAANLAAGYPDGTIRIHDTATGQIEQTFYGHANEVWAICWTADGDNIISGGRRDETFRIWDAGRRDRREIKVDSGAITSLDWGPNDSKVAVSTVWPGSISVWDWKDEKRTESHRINNGDTNFVAFQRDNQHIVYAGLLDGVVMRDLASRSTHTIGEFKTDALFSHYSGFTAILRNRPDADHRSAELIIIGSNGDQLVRIADAHQEAGSSIHLNTAATKAATTGIDGFLRVWDLKSQSLLWESEQHVPAIQQVRWNHIGTRLATTHPGYVTVWDARTGAVLKKMDDVHETFSSLDWHPSDTRLATASNVGVSLWDVDLGRVALKLPKQGVNCVRWSHNGRCLAAGGESTVTVWDTSDD